MMGSGGMAEYIFKVMSTTVRLRNRDLPVELMFHHIALAQSTVSLQLKIFQWVKRGGGE